MSPSSNGFITTHYLPTQLADVTAAASLPGWARAQGPAGSLVPAAGRAIGIGL